MGYFFQSLPQQPPFRPGQTFAFSLAGSRPCAKPCYSSTPVRPWRMFEQSAAARETHGKVMGSFSSGRDISRSADSLATSWGRLRPPTARESNRLGRVPRVRSRLGPKRFM